MMTDLIIKDYLKLSVCIFHIRNNKYVHWHESRGDENNNESNQRCNKRKYILFILILISTKVKVSKNRDDLKQTKAKQIKVKVNVFKTTITKKILIVHFFTLF